ncbi:integrator complex subunit 6 homolog [Lucilia cuprina]|uniref:integrator complex subunit 6 homolog n=1 Tax=Lucilia cuprina TaxID=7375 RepID=UPI001F065BAB|nr:integrator complex subunit 6 homolog [Lucilia cuprina]XP_046807199.1 integrator complex subunit 6 homolog [Lucilia cuprina]XP_046807200.1 integrator complex subunit 6 homolog [Lucilia cuprina]XP_046807201.1 integrator complex subunit 6 homolog [Lucilia cuprina]XP_046807202.1 integrator complex subunit 6 homolog [Lucilia cuprina]XP_046807203.1 integrator complex subunit 6 homolog [Lucilia cuprina]
MAKTRIKTTPTRMQKEALMASAAVTTTTNIVTEHVFKKRISVLKNSITAKDSTTLTTTTAAMPLQQSTIIVQPPKRTNSISSTTSNISHTSDGSHSCAESPPPNISTTPTLQQQSQGPTMAELTENAIKTLNAGLLAKSNALALKNRKVYMITEKCCDDATTNGGHIKGSGTAAAGSFNNGMAPGQKRKMYLIMEEKESDRIVGDQAEKLMKMDNTNNSKKLTLFTDTTNGQLPQKFEKILPEILNCIQAKKGNSNSCAVNNVPAINGKTEIVAVEQNTTNSSRSLLKTNENHERLPLTLPPKKNRTKIITTQIIPVNATTQQHAIYQQQQQLQSNGMDNWPPTTVHGGVVVTGVPNNLNYNNNNNNNGFCKTEKSLGATPVIVNASTLLNNNNNPTNGLKQSKENGSSGIGNSSNNQLHKNINLSTDFLFLMKMLPKLESIEEPHKTYVKTCIEDIINQYAANENLEQ